MMYFAAAMGVGSGYYIFGVPLMEMKRQKEVGRVTLSPRAVMTDQMIMIAGSGSPKGSCR